jgi:hypothetical protein
MQSVDAGRVTVSGKSDWKPLVDSLSMLDSGGGAAATTRVAYIAVFGPSGSAAIVVVR